MSQRTGQEWKYVLLQRMRQRVRWWASGLAASFAELFLLSHCTRTILVRLTRFSTEQAKSCCPLENNRCKHTSDFGTRGTRGEKSWSRATPMSSHVLLSSFMSKHETALRQKWWSPKEPSCCAWSCYMTVGALPFFFRPKTISGT